MGYHTACRHRVTRNATTCLLAIDAVPARWAIGDDEDRWKLYRDGMVALICAYYGRGGPVRRRTSQVIRQDKANSWINLIAAVTDNDANLGARLS